MNGPEGCSGGDSPPPPAVIERARDVAGLTNGDLAEALAVHPDTVRAWRTGEAIPTAEHRRALTKLHRLTELLEAVFPNADERQQSCSSPVPAFDDRTPYAVIRAAELDLLIEALASHHSGAFV